MTTFSTALKLELPGDGQQSGTWGQTTNKNLGTLIEQAITGVQSIVMTDTNYTLTSLNGVSDEARNAVLVVSGTNSAIRDVVAPLVNKLYTVVNSTSGGYAIRIRTASGSSVTVPNGYSIPVYCDGTNFYVAMNGSSGNFAISGDLSVTGTTTLTGATTVGGYTVLNTNNYNAYAPTLTGTGASGTWNIAITGNAATATNATNAANLVTTNWTVNESGGKLYFKYGGVNKMSLDSSGNIIALGNVTAYGTP